MNTKTFNYYTYDLGKYYTLLPQSPNWSLEDFIKQHNAVKVPAGFSYNSGNNTDWETTQGLRALIKEHVDSTFEL